MTKKGYTQEQIAEAIKLYQDRPDLTLTEIAKRLNISDVATISHWAKDAGLSLRRPKVSGWKKNSTSSNKNNKMITCPKCGKRYKPREGQKFCHLCGTDITPIEEKCKNSLIDIYTYINIKCRNPHILPHSDLIKVVKELTFKLKEAYPDLNNYFQIGEFNE